MPRSLRPPPNTCPTCQGNCEQLFSTAGNLSDPNMDPKFLGILVSIIKNKAAFNPPLAAIKEKYFAKFRGKGKEKKMDTSPPATPASGSQGAGPSGARSA